MSMFNTRNMHHIQQNIIKHLAHTSPLRFSQLQPANVPNNTFSYHLKKLVEAGYIAPTVKGYVATRKAMKTMGYGNDAQAKRTFAPLMITMVYVVSDKGRILLIKRVHRPFNGWYGIPSGLMHQGETIQAAAQRELLEKTGLDAPVGIEFVSVLDFKYLQADSADLFVHAVAFVYTYRYHGSHTALLEHKSDYGELRWSDLSHSKILPEVYAVAELARNGQAIVRSVDFEEPTESGPKPKPLVS